MKPTLIERMRVLRDLVRAAMRIEGQPTTPAIVTERVVRTLSEARSENPTVRFPDHADVLRAMAHLELEEANPKGQVH